MVKKQEKLLVVPREGFSKAFYRSVGYPAFLFYVFGGGCFRIESEIRVL